MSPEIQTVLALTVVALTAIWLLRRALHKDASRGCGSSGACGAVSPEIKKLQARLKR